MSKYFFDGMDFVLGALAFFAGVLVPSLVLFGVGIIVLKVLKKYE